MNLKLAEQKVFSCYIVSFLSTAGVGQPPEALDGHRNKHGRSIVASGIFGEYLMTVSHDAVVVIDGKRRHVQCEWQNIKHGNVIVWVDPTRL